MESLSFPASLFFDLQLINGKKIIAFFNFLTITLAPKTDLLQSLVLSFPLIKCVGRSGKLAESFIIKVTEDNRKAK